MSRWMKQTRMSQGMAAARFKIVTVISKRLLEKTCLGKGPFFQSSMS